MCPLPDDDPVLAALRTVTARVCGLDRTGLGPDQSLGDLALDSLSAVEIVTQVGDEFGIELNVRGVTQDWSTLTFRDLAAELRTTAPGPRPADQGLADQGLADQGLADQGLADQGLADQGLADQGPADQA